ncbi:MAG: VWA domain-containing protein [Desulfobaccales bacterium]
MAYEAPICRTHPGCIVLLIDQSGSMADTWGATQGQTKDKGVATAINRLLHNLVLKCSTNDGLRNYYDIGVISYQEPTGVGIKVGSGFGGPLAGRDLVSITEVAWNPLRVEERSKEEVGNTGEVIKKKVKFPIWIELHPDGGRPLRAALRHAYVILADWVRRHPDSYPPLVINITDGEATDGDPLIDAQRLLDLKTNDDYILLFHCMILARPGQVLFPAHEDELPNDQYSRLLFKVASELPPRILAQIKREFSLQEGARGFIKNSDFMDMIRFLDIGTRVEYR